MAPRLVAARTATAVVAALVALGTWAVVGPVDGAAAGGLARPAGADLACQASADGERVAVVVAFSASDVQRRCVAAGGSGIDVLRRAGFAPVTSEYQGVGGNAAVCAVTNPRSGEQMGCDAGPSCLTCAEPAYWSYYRGSTRGYTYQGVGGGSTTPQPGLVEAWQWGSSASWQHERLGTSAICTPPATTTTTTAAAPPGPGPTAGPGGGPGGGAGGSTGGGAGAGEPGGGPGGGTATTAAGDAGPGEHPPSTTTAPDGPADPDDPTASDDADADASDGDDAGGPTEAGTGDDEEAAGAPPGGTVAVRDGGDGGRGALVPALATGSAVAAFAALALRARRRRAGADPPPA